MTKENDNAKPAKPGSDMEILEDIRDRLYNGLIGAEPKTKVGDLVKVIGLKNRLTVSGKYEKKFWDMIDNIRDKKRGRKNEDNGGQAIRKRKQKSRITTNAPEE